jgi:polyferredoxin
MTRARLRLLLALVAGWWLVLGLPGAGRAGESELRFPPPEFESDYVMPPGITTPPPRGVLGEYQDLAVLAAALGLAAWLVHRKRSRRGLALLSLFSLLYFGFYRHGCICPIGAPQNVAYGLFTPEYTLPLTVLLFFLLPLVFALFAGRTFCAAVCPHGALQDLVLLRPLKVPLWLEQGLAPVPYLFLGAGVTLAAAGAGFLICRWDPFVPLFRMSGSFLMLGLGGVLVVASMFLGRPFCRFLCPYGALLRLAALVSRWRVRITPTTCTQCRLCEHSCPFGAIREPLALPAHPAALAPERRRLGAWLLATPVLVALGAWIGPRVAEPAARLHPNVVLLERYLAERSGAAVTNSPAGPAAGTSAAGAPVAAPAVAATPTPESRALARAELETPRLVAQAAELRRRLATAGGWLGGWVGLVLGLRMVSLSVRPARTEFEPDRGTCFACGRCYLSCPNERVRVGLISPAEAEALQADALARAATRNRA